MPVSKNARALVFDRDKKCLACGSTENLTIDHIIPLSLGGGNDITNLQALCATCNSKKGSLSFNYRPKDETEGILYIENSLLRRRIEELVRENQLLNNKLAQPRKDYKADLRRLKVIEDQREIIKSQAAEIQQLKSRFINGTEGD